MQTNAAEILVADSSQATNAREERGRQIAKLGGIKQIGARYAVPSQSGTASAYVVDLVEESCTCPDWELRRQSCKHVHATYFWLAWGCDVSADGTITETVTIKKVTRREPPRDWAAYNASQTNEGIYVEKMLRALCDGIEEPARKPGRGRKPIPMKDQAFATMMKVFSTKSQRRMQSDLADSVEKGNLERVANFNIISDFLGDAASTPILISLIEESAKPLSAIETGQFAMDSTGFSTVTYDRWFDQKHGKLMAEHTWVKLHIAVGTVTHAITGVKVSPEADCPQLPELLAQTAKHFDVREMSADKAYGSKDNHRTLERFGVAAFIPFKVNAKVDPKCAAWTRHLCEFLFNQDKFLPHYHRRSNVESVMWMIKSKFGAAVRSKNPTAQMNEVLAKCVLHNLACLVQAIFAAGLAPKFWQKAPAAKVLRLVPSTPVQTEMWS
jgi:transposase